MSTSTVIGACGTGVCDALCRENESLKQQVARVNELESAISEALKVLDGSKVSASSLQVGS